MEFPTWFKNGGVVTVKIMELPITSLSIAYMIEPEGLVKHQINIGSMIGMLESEVTDKNEYVRHHLITYLNKMVIEAYTTTRENPPKIQDVNLVWCNMFPIEKTA